MRCASVIDVQRFLYTVRTMAIRKPAAPKRVTRRKPKPEPTIWEKIEARGKRMPLEDLAQFPTDGARNFDHYLYGSPKQDQD